MKHHEIDLEGLQSWYSETKVLFASSTKEKKKLFATLFGGFELYHGEKIVWQGIQPFTAVEEYNKITHAP